MRRIGVLAVLVGSLLVPGLAADAGRLELDDLRWLDRSADPVVALSARPAECLLMPANPERAAQVALGRVAFRSPVLLGGVAARVRMSCDSCHRNGHGNPVFFFAGVSDAPGTADVTGSVFSTDREDGRANPVPIPSLVGAASHPPFGSVRPDDRLEGFVETVVVEEFQGDRPTAAVLEGLVAYIEALDPASCPASGPVRVDLATDAREIEETFDVLAIARERGDEETARFVLRSIRAALGRIHQRFPEESELRQRLIGRSRELDGIRTTPDGRGVRPGDDLDRVRRHVREDLRALAAVAERSYYDPSFLRGALKTPADHGVHR